MSVSRIADHPTDPTVSPKYRTSDWKALNLSTHSPAADWDTAVAIFHDRMDGRFLAQIEALLQNPIQEIREFSGFAIVALDCLLIETLGQFYNGIEHTRSGRHAQHFAEFFAGSEHFRNEFDARKSKLFYEHFRCGILHQAQTKKKSRIRFGLATMAEYADATDPEEGLILDRLKLHAALVAEIKGYEQLLKAPQSAVDQQKRDNFLRKWRFIVP